MAVLLEPGFDFVAAALSIMSLGIAYLPVDRETPVDEIGRRMQAVGARYGIVRHRRDTLMSASPATTTIEFDELMAAGSTGCIRVPRRLGGGEAYVLFTTGTTGAPKAVPISQRSLSGVLREFIESARIRGDGRWLWKHSPGFGFSMLELWGALLSGGTVVVSESTAPERLYDQIADGNIHVVCLTPAGFSVFDRMDEQRRADLEHIEVIILSGESVPSGLLAGWRQRRPSGTRVLSTYALSETAGQVSWHELDGTIEDVGTVGVELPGFAMFLVDEATHAELAGIGRGLIGIRSPYVFDGYYENRRRPRRRPAGELGTLITGDIGERLSDGTIRFVGRRGSIRKVLGYRIDLATIESAALECDDVTNAVAVVGGYSGKYVSLFVEAGEDALTTLNMRSFLRDRLPRYAIPSDVRIMTAFPTNLSAKVDRSALEQNARFLGSPVSAIGKDPLSIIMDAVGELVDQPDIYTGFLEQGMTSLDCGFLAATLSSAGYPISVIDTFRFSSANELARYCLDSMRENQSEMTRRCVNETGRGN